MGIFDVKNKMLIGMHVNDDGSIVDDVEIQIFQIF
jgi:hypothetical protein